ncbi:MAG: saccharopine dehydrogenase NADP-binding domain-containing protein [Candidatus Kapabacteria bacterium]|nr:saccharopine dehydrogenase NADP-binding domain-containing protein [Candidatus Kapabacteria bacterium]
MKTKKVCVLGAGLVGKAIAIDLNEKYYVTSVDKNKSNLEILRHKHLINTIYSDLSETRNIADLVQGFDLVVVAMPGFLGYRTLEAVINAGKNVVDISFFPEDAFMLDELAKEKNVTAVIDCGVAPGMGNLILGYHYSRMLVSNYECYVGGLPFERNYPFQYKAPFSPIDVIEEYTRPSRLVINNVIMIKEALSDPELIDFPGVGTLEAFNTDGLRSLLYTMNVKDMKEKTMRYPGHIEIIKLLKSIGLFDDNEIDYNGFKVSPRDFISKFLIDKWKLGPDEKEFTIMKVVVEGFEDEEPKSYTYSLFDSYDKLTGFSSMARTTGFTATAVADLILDDKITKKGILPPELIGDDEYVFKHIFAYQRERGIEYKISTD